MTHSYDKIRVKERSKIHKKLRIKHLSRAAIYTIFLFLYSAHTVCDPNAPFFSAPYSGEKVAEYQVALPVARNQDQSFKIPADCPAVIEALINGANRWGNRVQRSMWRKVQLDCEYVRFLSYYPVQPLHDYVSDYDFMNAELHNIAFPVDCREQEKQDVSTPKCAEQSILSMENFPFFDVWFKDGSLQEEQKRCRIDNGIFRGKLYYDQTGIHCVQGNENPAFRIIAIDYTDVNGDNYLDAILRLIPLGRGQSRAPIVLPLTRKEPDGKFTIPQNLPGPLPSP